MRIDTTKIRTRFVDLLVVCASVYVNGKFKSKRENDDESMNLDGCKVGKNDLGNM